MKRYTVFDANLGRYVVPLSRGQGGPPMAKTLIGGPMDVLFGEVVDHLAELEIAMEEIQNKTKEDTPDAT